jgi:hypothetical protein
MIKRWDWVVPGTFDLEASRILSKTGAITIFHSFEHKNSSFERILFQKHAKISIWKGSGSGSTPSTSRHRNENSGRFQVTVPILLFSKLQMT